MVSRLFGGNPFEELVEKSTSEFLVRGQEDLTVNLEICDQIRSKAVSAKDAMRVLKKRIGHVNPNVQLLALSLTDTCVKNGGHHFLVEIASREFVDNLVSILGHTTNMDVKNKLLSLTQTWGLAFEGKPELSYMTDTYSLLKTQGYVFPRAEKMATPVMIDTSTAPEWGDSDVCMRCRTPFTMINRKHHCRNCGQTFCGDCSSKNMPLPHFGYNDPVRVCDGCYMKKTLKTRSASFDTPNSVKPFTNSTPSTLLNGNVNAPNTPTTRRDDDDDDLKKAIELSLKETGSNIRSAPTPKKAPEQLTKEEQEREEADIAAAIAASLKDMQISQSYKSASDYNGPSNSSIDTRSSPQELTQLESDNIYRFAELVDRLEQTSGDLMRERQVQELYDRIGSLKPKLTKSLSETIQKHQELVDMHEKLAQVVRLYDNLLEERLSSAYMRRQSSIPYTSHPPVLSTNTGISYPPSISAQTTGSYGQHSYSSAPTPTPTANYYANQAPATPQYTQPSQLDTRAPQQAPPQQQAPYAAAKQQYAAYGPPQGGYASNPAPADTGSYANGVASSNQQGYVSQPNGTSGYGPQYTTDTGHQQPQQPAQQAPQQSLLPQQQSIPPQQQQVPQAHQLQVQPQHNYYQYQQSYQPPQQQQMMPPPQPQEEAPLIQL